MGIFDQNHNPNQGQSRFISRLIVAVIIGLIAWFTYMYQVEENPITGEKQHVAISPAQEVVLGLESAPQMAREMGGEVPPSDPRAREVTKIGQYLLAKSGAEKSPWKFNFHLLADDQTVNAFALPGGQVFITLGLFNQLQTEAQLAGVLGHEMGHVIERHSAEQMAKSQLGKMLVIAFSTGVSDPSYQQSNPAVIAGVVNQVIQLRYSRKDESEADIWGLKLMEKAGFDPWSMIKVMEILKAASGGARGSTPSIFQSHPDPDLRIEQIRAYLQKNPPSPDLKQGKNLDEMFPEAQRRGGGSLESLFEQLLRPEKS